MNVMLKTNLLLLFQILGCGSYGGPTSLLLHTDHRKYLFNCGEGTQRLTNQLSLGRALARLEHVFITSKTWRHLGGLPGVCLTARAAGAPDITIHGPPGCMELYQATKGFLTLFEFNVMAHSAEDGVFEDGAVKVEQVKLDRSVNKKCPNLPENWKEEEQGEFEDYDNTVQAYICHFSPKPGKLDIEKCEDLGVKPGPILGTLKAGKDVTLDDGRVVRSCDVVGDAAPP
jgi:ribonuclease Z